MFSDFLELKSISSLQGKREATSHILARKWKRTATSSNAMSVQTLPAMLELSYKTRQLSNQNSVHATFQNKNGQIASHWGSPLSIPTQSPIARQSDIVARGLQSQSKPLSSFLRVWASEERMPLGINMLIPPIIPAKKTMATVLVTANCNSISAKALLRSVFLRMNSGEVTFARKKSEQSLKRISLH